MSEQQSQHNHYDLVIIGAGSGGLTAAGFAARLGAKVALVERHRIGGDCTWTGCVPSKALLRAAKIAHHARSAAHYGITTSAPVADMRRVRDYVRAAIQEVYQWERPEELTRQGIDIVMGTARFLDAHTIEVASNRYSAKSFLITTGARPALPNITGLGEVRYSTYEQIFDNETLPNRMIVTGAGPVGMEMAQAYQRLGSQVTVIAERILPKEEPETREVMRRVFEREGVRFVEGRARSAHQNGSEIVVGCDREEVCGDLLLVASGRKPNVGGLDLEKAGIVYSEAGIAVDTQLRTNVKHIYAAGDVTGGHQFTHFAGWQAFQAARNALLPGSSSGLTDLVPRVTFTDPEVAHIGMTEAQAREKHGGAVDVLRWEMNRSDRAVCENDTDGFIKVVTKKDGAILGASIVAGRAGEAITELVFAMKNGMKLSDLAGTIHAYPTYSTAIQQMAAGAAVDSLLAGPSGTVIRAVSRILR